MAKLFVFGIGGTGSRVLKSLAFLLASGVKLNNCDEVVPIIVDPHQSNKDLIRTTEILHLYGKIRKHLNENEDQFFNSKISTLSSLKSENSIEDTFIFDLEGIAGLKFKHYIDYDSLDENNKALVDLLFTKENLESEMDIGFLGNPHIGSIVLNQFKDSDHFKTFANNFSKDDRIFIISSIFGGTGASGFPIILKNIRTASQNAGLAAVDFLENASIGALSILPYFNIEHNDQSTIQKSDWINKTKSALSYYEKNVTGNKSVNAMYYLGDTISKTYINDPGKKGQKNEAHLIEMIGALAVIDFANTPASELISVNGKAQSPYGKAFGIKEDSKEVSLDTLGSNLEVLIGKKLLQLGLFHKFINKHFDPGTKAQPYEITGEPKLDQSFYQNTFYRDYLDTFFYHFQDWIEEGSNNTRGMNILNLDGDLSTTANGIGAKKKGLFTKTSFGFDEMIRELGKASEASNYKSQEQKFMSLFFEATEEIISKNYDRF